MKIKIKLSILFIIISGCFYKRNFSDCIKFVNENSQHTNNYNKLLQKTEVNGHRNVLRVIFFSSYLLDSTLVEDVFCYYEKKNETLIFKKMQFQPSTNKPLPAELYLQLKQKADSIGLLVMSNWKCGYEYKKEGYLKIGYNRDGETFILLSNNSTLNLKDKDIIEIAPYWYFYDSKINYFKKRYYTKTLKSANFRIHAN